MTAGQQQSARVPSLGFVTPSPALTEATTQLVLSPSTARPQRSAPVESTMISKSFDSSLSTLSSEESTCDDSRMLARSIISNPAADSPPESAAGDFLCRTARTRTLPPHDQLCRKHQFFCLEAPRRTRNAATLLRLSEAVRPGHSCQAYPVASQ
ncbi:hypothetical protein KC330_g104 [Hortaea werneckii]|nr:hypothetical protein KC330_g104 [Hortaea werneckii]